MAWNQAKDKNLGNLSEKVRSLFEYDPNDGHLRWKVKRQKVIKGSIAGYVSKSDGYRYVCFDYNELLAHRVIWLLVTGDWPKSQIDHKNGIRDDNRLINLREATNGQNNTNKMVDKRNRLGVKGIMYDSDRKKYRVKISAKGKTYTVGRFDTLEEAKLARQYAEEEFYGEYAKVHRDEET